MLAVAPSQAKPDDANANLSVKLAPFSLDRKTIDLSQKAQDNVEEGLTQWFFHCLPEVDIIADKGKKIPGGYSVSVSIHKVRIVVSASVSLYLPVHASPALVAHEQGHVQICKSIYSESALAAQTCGRDLLKRTFVGNAGTQAAANEQATEVARKWFCRKFMALTEDRVQKLSIQYDALTDHGRASIPSSEAVNAVLLGSPAQK